MDIVKKFSVFAILTFKIPLALVQWFVHILQIFPIPTPTVRDILKYGPPSHVPPWMSSLSDETRGRLLIATWDEFSLGSGVWIIDRELDWDFMEIATPKCSNLSACSNAPMTLFKPMTHVFPTLYLIQFCARQNNVRDTEARACYMYSWKMPKTG